VYLKAKILKNENKKTFDLIQDEGFVKVFELKITS